MHFSLPKMCTLVLATSFALFLAKKIAPQFLPPWMALSSHFPLPKTLHFSKRFAFFALSNGVIDRGSKQQSKRSNFQLHRSSFSPKKSKKMNQINTKNYWKLKKRLCVRLRLGNKHHLRKSADRKAQIRKAFVPLTELICAFRSAGFLRWCLFPKRNLAHNLFFYFQ